MNKGSTIFLRFVIFLVGAAVVGLCTIALPMVIISDNVGYYRPLLIGMYIPAIPFFIALYQSLRLLKYIDQNNAFSDVSVRALKSIKYCALTISAFYLAGMPYIVYVADRDDAPGVVALGLVIIFASFVIAVFSAVLQRLLQNVLDIKAENDLTV